MQIFGPFRVSTAQPLGGPQRMQTPPQVPANNKPSVGPVDQLDLSQAASRMEAVSPMTVGGDIRIERVAELRRQIAGGNYDTAEKLDRALDRMLDRFA